MYKNYPYRKIHYYSNYKIDNEGVNGKKDSCSWKWVLG